MRLVLVRPLAVLAFLFSATAARADVVVVDPAGGPGGALLQGAINTAHDGDILLLRAGDYTDTDITIAAKLVSLVADPPGASVTLRRLTVNLPLAAGSTILLRGLTVAAPALTSAPPPSGITLNGNFSNTTSVWVEDCVANGSLQDIDGPGGLPHVAGAGLDCLLGIQAVLVRCTFTGADGFDAVPGDVATGGGAGMQCLIASPLVFEGTFTGGAGGDGAGDGVISTDGGPGIHIAGALGLAGCTLRGGNEGADNGTGVKPGAGLQGDTFAHVRDVDAQPGSVVGTGTPSPPIALGPLSTLIEFPAAARTLSVASPLREGELGALALHGEVGDAVFIYIGGSSALKLVKPAQGDFALAGALGPFFVGPITDASGDLDVGFHMPNLPPGTDGIVLYLQSAMAPAAGGLLTGSGSALVWVDDTL